jgi:hypothetical protein
MSEDTFGGNWRDAQERSKEPGRQRCVGISHAHRSIGTLTWIVVATRLVWRHGFAYLPPFPASMPKLQQRIAKFNEYALYTLLLAQPLSGLGVVSWPAFCGVRLAGACTLRGRQDDLPRLRITARTRRLGAPGADWVARCGRSLPRAVFARRRLSTDAALDYAVTRPSRPRGFGNLAAYGLNQSISQRVKRGAIPHWQGAVSMRAYRALHIREERCPRRNRLRSRP